MKIGIDISQIVYKTGVSRYTKELVTHLAKLYPDNQYFLYGGSLRQKNILRSFTSSLKSSKLTSKITSLSPRLADLLWNRLSIFDPTQNQDLDIFHASNWALPKTHSKLVTTIHDLSFIKYPETHSKKSVAIHTRHLNKSKKMADLVITDAESTKKDLIEYGFDPQKITVIPLAASESFRPSHKHKKEKFILSVGTNEPRKNLVRLIKAYSKLDTDHQLWIVGKFGWGEELKPTKGVRLLGFVSDADLVDLYSSATAFIYPSLYEGFGFPVLEAMACGCPTITSNISSLPEVGGSAVTYVNPNSVKEISTAISQMINLKPKQRASLVKKSINQANKFSWESTAKQTLDAYKKLLVK